MAEEQDAARVQPLVEHLDGRLSGACVEVDEHVAAEDGVGAAEDARAVLVEQVHLPEMAELTDRFGTCQPSGRSWKNAAATSSGVARKLLSP